MKRDAMRMPDSTAINVDTPNESAGEVAAEQPEQSISSQDQPGCS